MQKMPSPRISCYNGLPFDADADSNFHDPMDHSLLSQESEYAANDYHGLMSLKRDTPVD